MIVGFNHNFGYKGQVYHVQTEDGGLKSPNIITLLYKGGTILASKKTSYADIIKSDHLEVVVEELMKEQHREMLRRLRGGDFDDLLTSLDVSAVAANPSPAAVEPPPAVPRKVTVPPPPPPAAMPARPRATTEASLDEIILSYLAGDDERR